MSQSNDVRDVSLYKIYRVLYPDTELTPKQLNERADAQLMGQLQAMQSYIQDLLEQSNREARENELKTLLKGFEGRRGTRFTKKQLELVRFVMEYEEKYGYPPELQEVSSHFGIANSTLSQHFHSIRKKVNSRLDQLQHPEGREE